MSRDNNSFINTSHDTECYSTSYIKYFWNQIFIKSNKSEKIILK